MQSVAQTTKILQRDGKFFLTSRILFDSIFSYAWTCNFKPFLPVLDAKELPVRSEPRHCCCRWSERVILTQRARKSGVKLHVVEELGLGLPKKGAKKCTFFRPRTENAKKRQNSAVKLFQLRSYVQFFFTRSSDRRKLTRLSPRQVLEPLMCRELTKSDGPREIVFCDISEI